MVFSAWNCWPCAGLLIVILGICWRELSCSLRSVSSFLRSSRKRSRIVDTKKDMVVVLILSSAFFSETASLFGSDLDCWFTVVWDFELGEVGG